MKRPELYKKTCDILYDSYFNETLEHGNCSACAVGNLISYNNSGWCSGWWYEFIKGRLESFVLIKNENITPESVLAEIESTGYSVEEIIKIERAFESVGGECLEDMIFDGLCSVIETLNKIHEVEEDNQTQRFEQHYKSKILSNELQ